jgi:hypothetical protein
MIVPRYAPGRWQAVVTDGHICLLPPDVDPDTVVALWSAVREGAGLTAQLQLLLAGGLDALPPFALVALERERVHVVVRGDVEVHVDGDEPRTVRGRRVATWQEDVIDGAGAVVVRVLDAGTGTDARLPVLSAVVPADVVAVDLRSGGGRSVAAEGDAVPAAAPVAAPAPEPVAAERAPERVDAERAPEPVAAVPAPEPAVRPEHVVDPEPEAAVDPEPAVDPDPRPVVRPAWAPVARDAQQAAAEAGPSSSVGRQSNGAAATPPVRVALAAAPTTADGLEDLEHTVLHAATDTSVGLPLADVAGSPASAVPGPAAVPAPEVLPGATPAPAAAEDQPASSSPHAAEDDADHDGTTVLSSDVVALRRQLPDWAGDGVPGPLAVPAADRPAPAKIRLSSGLVVSLTRPVLLGRAPQVSRVSNREMPRLVTVASPRQDISRTHAEVRMDGDDVLVTDLRSTNGVLLLRQGHGPQRLHPGEPTVVEPGVSVDLGEGVTFVVEPGA